MIKEVYHPRFSDDLEYLHQELGTKKFQECLIQIDRAINQILRNPHKAAPLKYAPLQGFRKKKFFSVSRPRKKQRPNMRIIYRYVPAENTIYFLAVGLRIAERPHNPYDVYQRARKRNFKEWKKDFKGISEISRDFALQAFCSPISEMMVKEYSLTSLVEQLSHFLNRPTLLLNHRGEKIAQSHDFRKVSMETVEKEIINMVKGDLQLGRSGSTFTLPSSENQTFSTYPIQTKRLRRAIQIMASF